MTKRVRTVSKILLLVLGAGLWLALVPEGKVESRAVVYFKKGKQEVTGFLARPTAGGKHPAIILIHEWWGLNDDIRAKAEEFARLGYVALAVDLYHGASTTEPSRARELAVSVRNNMEEAFDNLRAAIAFVRADSSVDDGRIASIGWCFGGGWSYQIAKNNLGVKASVIYYGRFNPKDDLQKMRAEIIGHFADHDRGIRVDTVREFQARLKTLHGDHEIYIYPNTTHGFASRKGSNPNYNAKAADLAWQRTLAFLRKHL
ncbi:MAG: dienelactone hydrolase family protein [Calditrichaeota bacterium]|nr:MAG: dienelactone hydrolase family protein [Calditrichota bacterium]